MAGAEEDMMVRAVFVAAQSDFGLAHSRALLALHVVNGRTGILSGRAPACRATRSQSEALD
jgi:hypothetical protein